jgi:hypothetical protein
MPKSSIQARAALLAANQGTPRRLGYVSAALVAAVVLIVRVAVPAEPVMETGVVEPNVKVGRSCAPAGLDAMAAFSATLPVKTPPGVTVIVEVFPVVAPGATETALPLTVKLGGTGVVTVTEAVPVALLKAGELFESGV